MTQLTDTELNDLDTRGYITTLGINAEKNAKLNNETVKITHLVVDGGLLPSDKSPVDVTELVHDYGEQAKFAASVVEDDQNEGGFIVQINITADHHINNAGYKIWGLAAVTDKGIIHSYRRVEGDFKTYNPNSSKSYTYRLRFLTSNADVISFTVDPTIVIATKDDLDKAVKEHEDKQDPHPQYATDDDLTQAMQQAGTDLSDLISISQFLPYDETRKYKTGEICYTKDQVTNELSYWQWYSNVESLAGKSPLLDANRHVGWSDNTKPFYWVPYTGDQVGMPFLWLDNSAPEWAVMEINVDLPIAVYWRLARRYPHLVSGNVINTGEIRGEFLRVLDQGRGIDPGRTINSVQDASKNYYTGRVGGYNGAAWADGLGYEEYTGRKENAKSTLVESGSRGELSLAGGTQNTMRLYTWDNISRNVARPMAIVI
ncbi:phage tail protein [Vibrio sp. Isolate24]|uniref:phage tail protein n=1 Tax=Vibrio sp. Isolate24 TaxID=2908534 RepID=UPI001EFCE992|nr:phage tail protein [Vibrio sp. Isolate24]MCG9678751.1 phage tail protein [Vibrio sp. Isolate24]